MKHCSKCDKDKPLDAFAKNRATKDGLQNWCKECHAPLQRRWTQNNKKRRLELGRQWYRANREHALALRRKRYAKRQPEIRAKQREWYAQNRHKMPARNRKHNLRRYGLSLERYAQMFDQQQGLCAICRTKGGKRRLSVDHCHKKGGVRALLCDGCNLGLGYFKESSARLRAAAAYIESFDRSPVE